MHASELPGLRTVLGIARPLAVASIALGCCSAAEDPDVRAAPETKSERPNVVLILTDDQGYGDLGVTGNPFLRTPHLDRLAGESASLEYFYVSPVCSPTRASLLTGRYNYRTRVTHTSRGRAMMDPEEVTLAEVLSRAGYATGIFGKWHLGDNYPLRAMDQGFEESLVHTGGVLGPGAGPESYTNPRLLHNGAWVQRQGYCTEVFFDAAMEWIEAVHRERPFFAFVSTNVPHTPWDDVPREQLATYRRMDLRNERFPQEVGHPLPADGAADLDRRARIYAMVADLDDNVGRLMERLSDLGLEEDTLVVFLVDNGPKGRRYQAGMRGQKGKVYEGGIRSPFFVRWPGRLAAGRRSDRIAAHIDLLPTLAEACGVPLPDDVELDGRSVLPLLSGEGAPDWPDRRLFFQSNQQDVPVLFHNFAVRTQRWKLVHATGEGAATFGETLALELFDMRADPLETRDVSAEHPEVVAELRQAYEAWFADVSSSRPDNYEPPRIRIGTPAEDPVELDGVNQRREPARWLVHVGPGRRYLARVPLPAGAPRDGRVVLRCGGRSWSAPVGGRRGPTIEGVELPEGDATLEVLHVHGGVERPLSRLVLVGAED